MKSGSGFTFRVKQSWIGLSGVREADCHNYGVVSANIVRVSHSCREQRSSVDCKRSWRRLGPRTRLRHAKVMPPLIALRS